MGDTFWHNQSRKRIEVLIDSEFNESPKWDGWLPRSDTLLTVMASFGPPGLKENSHMCPLSTVLLLAISWWESWSGSVPILKINRVSKKAQNTISNSMVTWAMGTRIRRWSRTKHLYGNLTFYVQVGASQSYFSAFCGFCILGQSILGGSSGQGLLQQHVVPWFQVGACTVGSQSLLKWINSP